MFGIDSIIFAIIALHCLALGWLIKATGNFVMLYFGEHRGIDLVIALLFLGLVLDRAWSIWGFAGIFGPVGAIQVIQDDVYSLLNWRVASLIVLNSIFLLFDLVFFRYRHYENSA